MTFPSTSAFNPGLLHDIADPAVTPAPGPGLVDRPHIGIDVGGDRLDIYILPAGEHLHISNRSADIARWLDSHPAFAAGVALVAFEPTGKCEYALQAELRARGIAHLRVNLGETAAFARMSGRRAKTDRLDAQMLAEFAVYKALHGLTHMDFERDELLVSLVMRRQDLQEMCLAEQDRLRRESQAAVQADLQAHIAWLQARKQHVEREIQARIKAVPAHRDKQKLLISMLGVGPAISAILIALLPELGHLDNAQIAALVGVAPFNHQSGKSKNKGRIRGGRSPVRKALYMGARVAARCAGPMKDFADRLRTAGKPFHVAITAVMRKMIVTLNAMLKTQTEWQKNPSTSTLPA